MRVQQRKEVAALGMVSTFRVDWARIDSEERAYWDERNLTRRTTWKGEGTKKWVSGMGQLSGNERNFLRDQSERTLLSKVAIGKTSALMGVAENPQKRRFEKLECLVSAEAPTPDHSCI